MECSSSVAQLVAGGEHAHRQHGQHHEKTGDNREARERIDIRHPEETVAKTVDHVEKRIEPRYFTPYRRKRMRRVEHARQERERRNQKILKRGELVELFGPDTGDQAERAENRRAEQRE